MTPDRLAGWERILQSDVAIALLLLGAVLTLFSILLMWLNALRLENQELKREFVAHLKTRADLSSTLTEVGKVMDLLGRHHDRDNPTGDSAVEDA